MSIKTSVSFPKSVLDKAQARAATLGFTSLSGYLQHLVRKDDEENPPKVPESTPQYVDLLDAIRKQTARMDQLLERAAEAQPLRLQPPPSEETQADTEPKRRKRPA